MDSIINFTRDFVPMKSDTFREIRRKMRLYDTCILVLKGIIIGVAMSAFMVFVLV